MNILAAIKREENKVRKQLAKLQNQLNGLASAAEALGNSTSRQVDRELKVVKKCVLSAAGRAANCQGGEKAVGEGEGAGEESVKQYCWGYCLYSTWQTLSHRTLQPLAKTEVYPSPDPRGVERSGTYNKSLLLEYQRRPTNSLPLEVDYHFDAVGDLYQGDAFVHAIVLAVEGHRPCNLA